MVLVHLCLVVGMAVEARKDTVVARVRMTVTTSGPPALVGSRIDREPGMVEGRPGPCRRRVAHGAVVREARCGVIRVRGAGVLLLMTGVAVCWGARILPADVAVDALHVQVGSRQRKRRLTVVESCARPAAGRVANRTILRETSGSVVRICGVVVVC